MWLDFQFMDDTLNVSRFQMWKATVGLKLDLDTADDDWETDPSFVNDVTEEEQRWGSRTIEGSGRTGGAIK